MSRFFTPALLALLIAATPLRAVVATALSSFEALEEPSVKFVPATGAFLPDDFVNIQDLGGGTFRMINRFNAEWWDGDRDTRNRDRQRAEVKGLGPRQRHGETFEYATTWRLNGDFQGTAGFCHIFQLKATNGDSGAPLVTLSIRGDKARVEANSILPNFVAREFPWKAGVWQSVRIRVKTSPTPDGELLVSVDGDEFSGRTGVALARPQADEYRPKWGLYRRAAANARMGDDYVEHRAVSAQKLGAPIVDNVSLETEARARARDRTPAEALAWLQSRPASAARDFAIASLAAFWSERDPAAAMAWTETLPKSALRVDATERVFSRWADQHSAAAMDWVRSRAPQAELDPLLWLLATDTTYRYVNRPIALDAAGLITASELRGRAFEHVVEIWARDQREAAHDYVNKSAALTAEQKHAILARTQLQPKAP
jgi:hypothetical protein